MAGVVVQLRLCSALQVRREQIMNMFDDEKVARRIAPFQHQYLHFSQMRAPDLRRSLAALEGRQIEGMRVVSLRFWGRVSFACATAVMKPSPRSYKHDHWRMLRISDATSWLFWIFGDQIDSTPIVSVRRMKCIYLCLADPRAAVLHRWSSLWLRPNDVAYDPNRHSAHFGHCI